MEKEEEKETACVTKETPAKNPPKTRENTNTQTPVPMIDNCLHSPSSLPLHLKNIEAAHAHIEEEFITKHKLQKYDNLWHTTTGSIFIPSEFREACMYFFHFSKYGVHMSATKMFHRMKHLCWWPGMEAQLTLYVYSCLACTRYLPKPSRQNLGTLATSRPALIVAIDGYGPFTYAGIEYTALTIIDHYTKYAEVVAWLRTTSVTAQLIWAAFYRYWIALWGCPVALLSDNATVLESEYIHNQCAQMNIRKIRSTSYHPQSNGMIESWHRTLKAGLLAGTANDLTLTEALASTLFAYRTTPHDSTGQTPMYLHVGYDALLPGYQQLALTQSQPPHPERMNALNEIRKLTLHTISSRVIARERNKRAKQKHPTFKVGDLVVCRWRPAEIRWRNELFGGAKFAPKWSEPRRITNISGSPPARLTLSSVWFSTNLHEISIHDTRSLSNPSYESVLRENLRYVIASLTRHTEAITHHPAPPLRPNVLAEHQKETEQAVEKLREASKDKEKAGKLRKLGRPRAQDKTSFPSLPSPKQPNSRQTEQQQLADSQPVPEKPVAESWREISEAAGTESEGGELWAGPVQQHTHTSKLTPLFSSQPHSKPLPDNIAADSSNFLPIPSPPPPDPEAQTQHTSTLNDLLPQQSLGAHLLANIPEPAATFDFSASSSSRTPRVTSRTTAGLRRGSAAAECLPSPHSLRRLSAAAACISIPEPPP
eukprot:GHVU01087859.1.p1 GENE.GHVU01087859.1~~GHVU01087859.1.p1  ORF type:complete len:711 (-),score=64.63 GHVU01087859.1:235-2367(-)